MSKFSTSINKLNKLWQEVEANKNNIKIKDNNDKFTFFTNLLKQQNIIVPTEIFDSGSLNLSPTLPIDAFTAKKSELLPTLVSYSNNIEINLPEVLLPFVKYSIEITPLPNTEIHGVYEYDPSTWIGDNIEVRGDGVLIYRGSPVVSGSPNLFFLTFSPSFFLNNNISLSLSKETWLAVLDTISLGGHTGKILTVDATEITALNSCLTNDDTKKFTINHFDNKNHKIINLTETGFSGIGDEVITTYTSDGGGGCNQNIVTNTNVSRTIIFEDMDDFGFTLAEASQIGLRFGKDTITELDITKEDRWLFYSTELQKLFQTVVTDPNDGDFKEIVLTNLPDTNAGDILPYTNITVKRNIEGINSDPTIEKQSDGVAGTSTLTSLERTGREFKNYIKLSFSEADIPIYRFNLQGSFLIIAPSIQKSFETRDKANIITQEFKSFGSNDWNVQIDKNLSSFISGTVANIFHRKERLSGSVITEFFTDPVNNSKHGITSLTSTSFTAVGDETVTIIPVDPELPTEITTRSNIIVTNTFVDSTNYSIGIENTIDFPIYNDIYTVVGTSYGLTTENHSILPKNIWVPNTDEVTINIKAHLINPLYWREERKYNDI